jgi:hypothetical protein
MKSDPAFSTVKPSPTSTDTGSVSAASAAADGVGALPRGGTGGACCAPETGATSATVPAAALAAAPFKNPRRPTAFFLDFATIGLLPVVRLPAPPERAVAW